MNSITKTSLAHAQLQKLFTKAKHGCMRSLRQAERGEAESFEFVSLIIPMMVTFSLIAFAVMYWSAKLPAKRAAIDCARNAVATLDETIGRNQGQQAGVQALVAPDNMVSPAKLAELQSQELTLLSTGVVVKDLTVDPRPFPDGSTWVRGGLVRCKVRYTLNISELVMLNFVQPWAEANGILEIQETATLAIEPYKSDWR